MKKHLFIILSLFCLLTFCSCEKPYEEENEDNTETTDKPNNDDSSGDDDDSWGGDDGGDDDDNPDDSGISLGDEVSVATFCNTPIYTQIWLKGYIVGAATGANGKMRYEFTSPFNYDTAILLADSPTADDNSEVASVCLNSCSKAIREELNLKAHPENKGKRLKVFGFQGTYLKLPGIKKIDAYEFK